MIYTVLVVLGLALGSFINAFVWRLHEGRDWVKERSECTNCHHPLNPKDLIPVFSWLALRGKCRYCHRPISVQYPLVEAATAALFVLSYIFWPVVLKGGEVAVFIFWLVLLIGLLALLVYDVRWKLLPNKIIFPLLIVASLQALTRVFSSNAPVQVLIGEVLGVIIGGGLFYVLFQISSGRWIGGGDVKLGFLLGLIVGSGEKSLVVIFLAAILGSLVSIPLLVAKRLKRTSTIPFGPFLIVAAIVVVLFGDGIVQWYNHTFLLIG